MLIYFLGWLVGLLFPDWPECEEEEDDWTYLP